MTTTLRKILDAKPCYDPRDRGFLPADHDLDAPISFREIIAVAGLDDTIWCLRTTHKYAISRRFALDCAERVRHLMTDPRSTNALDVARRHLAGDASDEELAAASDAARAAWGAVASDAARGAAWAAWGAAEAAVWAARAAAWAAGAAVWTAAAAAEAAAAEAAVWAARAAVWAAGAAVWDAEREWQAARLIELTEGEAP